MPTVNVFPTEAALAEAAADLFVQAGAEALAQRGSYRVALSGGRGPQGMFAALAERPRALDWAKVELYWADERWVEAGDSQSNFGEARRRWLDHWAAGPRCFPMVGAALTPAAAAAAYAALLMGRFGAELPAFDLVLLGMGPDGHTASLFPGQASLDERQRLCLAVTQPATGQARLTLTLPVLNAARRCAFLLGGAEKAGLLARVLAGQSDVPAARVHPAAGEPLWLTDAAAAAQIR
jgi:6-phosphogluconolactonase